MEQEQMNFANNAEPAKTDLWADAIEFVSKKGAKMQKRVVGTITFKDPADEGKFLRVDGKNVVILRSMRKTDAEKAASKKIRDEKAVKRKAERKVIAGKFSDFKKGFVTVRDEAKDVYDAAFKSYVLNKTPVDESLITKLSMAEINLATVRASKSIEEAEKTLAELKEAQQ